jgi:hypothetical protein
MRLPVAISSFDATSCLRGAPFGSATGKGADSTASRGGSFAGARSCPAASRTDCDQVGHASGHGAQGSVSLQVPSPRNDKTDVDESFLSRIRSTGGSKAVLW